MSANHFNFPRLEIRATTSGTCTHNVALLTHPSQFWLAGQQTGLELAWVRSHRSLCTTGLGQSKGHNLVARIDTRWTYFESSPDQSLADRVGLAGNGRVPALKIAGGFQEMSDGLANGDSVVVRAWWVWCYCVFLIVYCENIRTPGVCNMSRNEIFIYRDCVEVICVTF